MACPTYTAGMAGRIRTEDVALVREQASIAEVIGDHVTLKPAGGGSLKGLCPFHEERSPSFHVTPAKGLYHCFGCQVGGDVIDFLQRIDHLTFQEAVEKLAARAGITLRYEESGVAPRRQQGERTRLLEANKVAAAFYRERLDSGDAAVAHRFLSERGFDQEVAGRFGVGFAPQGWDVLTKHLRASGFTDHELQVSGLAKEGPRGLIDRFRGRLLWPIRDISGDVIGFGARKLLDDDNGPKYLNTPETPIYHKGQVLYGIDLAKRDIANRRQAVIVEGYTDVMACHLSGVTTAVATCGTSFGEDHIRVLRRLLMDSDAFNGEVVFLFDGDAAGQKAAMRAFSDDQKFVSQTFVAVESSGLDPCELRQQQGDEAVQALVDRRVPLFEFAIKSVLTGHDLNFPAGRIAALRAAAPVVARIRDHSLRPEYARSLAGWLGMEVRPVQDAVTEAARAQGNRSTPTPDQAADAASLARPDPRDRSLFSERELLKLAIQHPQLLGKSFDELPNSFFTHPAYRAVTASISAAGGIGAADGKAWIPLVSDRAANDAVRSVINELAVEPLRTDGGALERYAREQLARAEERVMSGRIDELRSSMQRLEGIDQKAYAEVFAELVHLEQERRKLHEQAYGSD